MLLGNKVSEPIPAPPLSRAPHRPQEGSLHAFFQQRILPRLQVRGQTYLAASAYLICPLNALEMAPSRESPGCHLRDPGWPRRSAPTRSQ